MTKHKPLHAPGRFLLLTLALALAVLPRWAHGQEWEAVKFFQYNIENVAVTPTGSGGSLNVRVIFSVTNPVLPGAWDIQHALPFTSAGANLTLDIGWDPGTDFTNTGSTNPSLAQVSTKLLGTGAAIPVQVRGLQGASGKASLCTSYADCPGAASLDQRYWVEAAITPIKFVEPVAAGRVALEGRPVCNGVPGYSCPPGPTPGSYPNIPVTSAVASFWLNPADPQHAMIPDAADPRRPIVDIAKCKACHDGNQHGGTVVPRLSLHGGNRNENLKLCVMCHNPNQTDVPYRTLTTPAGAPADARVSGDEVSIDFKRMIHSIHAGGFRRSPFVVIGFNSSINDFSGVRFPAELGNCLNCHVESKGKGTFELPLQSTVLGSTVTTGSVYKVAQPQTGVPGSGQLRQINVDPNDDLKITPTAAVCSSCHDRAEVRAHMIRTGGASFATTQQAIGFAVRERCANCHGPGNEEDIRRAHEIGSGSSNPVRSRDD